MERISLYERRRQLIAVLYERQNDTVGNLAFEFSVSSHTIRNDIRVLELESPIYTRMGARWRRVCGAMGRREPYNLRQYRTIPA